MGPSAVIGLEGGRELARRHQRRRQIKDKMFGMAGAIVALGVVASAAYIGYTIYEETQKNDQIEADQRQAERDRQDSGNNLNDAIDELEENPRWNGPGNPNFGVGERVEVIAPVTVPDSGG